MWRQVRIPPLYPLQVVEGDKRELVAWGYNRAILSMGDINIKICSFRLMALPCKKIIVCKIQRSENLMCNSRQCGRIL
jgi:hypothetical protein